MALFNASEMLAEGREVNDKSMQVAMESMESLLDSSSSNKQFDIFLSHSFSDRAYVKGVWNRLTRMGYSVYVDWIHDVSLDRSKVTPATAKILRNRMSQCKALFYAVSTNSSASKWMPWELGFKDGEYASAAILPIVEEAGKTTYAGMEYLGLYHYASDQTRGRVFNRAALVLTTHNGKVVPFDSWIVSTILRRS